MVDGEHARILILGTHKDQESECITETRKEKNEKIKKLLLPAFQSEALYSGVDRQPIFAVNAKSPADEDQKVAEEIRKLVMKDTSCKPAEIPLRWYALELLLEEMTYTLGRGVLSSCDSSNTRLESIITRSKVSLYRNAHAQNQTLSATRL